MHPCLQRAVKGALPSLQGLGHFFRGAGSGTPQGQGPGASGSNDSVRGYLSPMTGWPSPPAFLCTPCRDSRPPTPGGDAGHCPCPRRTSQGLGSLWARSRGGRQQAGLARHGWGPNAARDRGPCSAIPDRLRCPHLYGVLTPTQGGCGRDHRATAVGSPGPASPPQVAGLPLRAHCALSRCTSQPRPRAPQSHSAPSASPAQRPWFLSS